MKNRTDDPVCRIPLRIPASLLETVDGALAQRAGRTPLATMSRNDMLLYLLALGLYAECDDADATVAECLKAVRERYVARCEAAKIADQALKGAKQARVATR